MTPKFICTDLFQRIDIKYLQLECDDELQCRWHFYCINIKKEQWTFCAAIFSKPRHMKTIKHNKKTIQKKHNQKEEEAETSYKI